VFALPELPRTAATGQIMRSRIKQIVIEYSAMSAAGESGGRISG